MFCTQCGTQLADTARYCTSCGKPTGPRDEGSNPALPLAAAGPAPRKLRRIISEKKIAGVCAGFAEYFDTDLTLMRVIWVALLLLPPNLGLIAYIVAWAVMPKG
jgi:phage shock protein C